VRRTCSSCGGTLWSVYETQRTVTTLDDVCRLTLTVVRCHNPACSHYHRPYRPEEEGAWTLPHHEFGLDVIALVGTLRYRHHRSIPEIHQALREQHVAIAPRTVAHLLARYEELLALRLADHTRLQDRLRAQGHVILALDGLQPHNHQDVLWVLRDCLSGEVLLARSLNRAREADLAELLREVQQALPVPIRAVVSDAQRPIRLAVQRVLPDIPHQLCQYHYLKEAAKPITEADRHAKTELKKYVRGVRAIEEDVAPRTDTVAATIRGYCLAVRSAVSDAGKPPLQLPGLAMHDRLRAIQDSLERVAEKKGFQPSWSSCVAWWQRACSPPPDSGRRCRPLSAGSTKQPRCWPTTRAQTRRRWRRGTEVCLQTC
jgi:AcrR family transcriptional regulator